MSRFSDFLVACAPFRSKEEVVVKLFPGEPVAITADKMHENLGHILDGMLELQQRHPEYIDSITMESNWQKMRRLMLNSVRAGRKLPI
jgi:hypothetical protein